jgi:hypothetical protein
MEEFTMTDFYDAISQGLFSLMLVLKYLLIALPFVIGAIFFIPKHIRRKAVCVVLDKTEEEFLKELKRG